MANFLIHRQARGLPFLNNYDNKSPIFSPSGIIAPTMLKPHEIQARLERILPTVQKPGRYTGGELNQIVKDWDSVETTVAMVQEREHILTMVHTTVFHMQAYLKIF